VVDPHPVVRRTRGEIMVGQQRPLGFVGAIDVGVDGDLGVAALAPHLLGALHRPLEQPVGDHRLLRPHLDPDDLTVALAERGAVSHRQTVPGKHQEAVGAALESRLDDAVGDFLHRSVRESDQARVVGRKHLEQCRGVGRLRCAHGVTVRQYSSGIHTSQWSSPTT
jgi:hypothetical protein